MSWQSYIDDQLLMSGFMYASINSFDGSLWACSPGFTVTASEIAVLRSALKEGGMNKLATTGFTIAGQRYTFTRGEADEDDGDGSASMQGRCKEEGKSSQGVIIYSSFQAILVGVHDPQYSNGIGFGKANTEMGKVVDYMLENNY